MKRRLLPILMTLVLVCALPIWAAFVTSGDVTKAAHMGSFCYIGGCNKSPAHHRRRGGAVCTG